MSNKEFENTVRVSGILERKPYVGDSNFGGGKYTFFGIAQRYSTKGGLKQIFFDCQYQDDIFKIINEEDIGSVKLTITGELVSQKKKNKDGVEYWNLAIKAHTVTPDMPHQKRKPMAAPSPVMVTIKSTASDANEDLPF